MRSLAPALGDAVCGLEVVVPVGPVLQQALPGFVATHPQRIRQARAMPHAQPGQAVEVGRLGARLPQEKSVALFKSAALEVMRPHGPLPNKAVNRPAQ